MARFNFQTVLKKHQMKHLGEMKRDIKGTTTTHGYVVDFSDRFVLFANLDYDMFQLNGYALIRYDDISKFRFFDKATSWQFRAAKYFRLKPIKPQGIVVTSLPELITTVAKQYPLLTVHTEKKDPDVCSIGSLLSMTERTFTIDDLDSTSEWTGPRRFRFEDVTQINFGGGYETALAVTAPKRASRKGSVA